MEGKDGLRITRLDGPVRREVLFVTCGGKRQPHVVRRTRTEMWTVWQAWRSFRDAAV